MRPGDPAQHSSRLGALLIAGSAIAYSSAGFFTRLIKVDLWTLIFWRGVFSSAFLVSVGLAQRRLRWREPFWGLDRWAWIAVAFSTSATFCYLAALRSTTVADVAIVYGTAPFVTAGLAVVLVREATSAGTLLCSAVALTGVIVMFGDSRLSVYLGGDLLAVAMTVLMAVMIIAIRRSVSASLTLAAVSAGASAAVALPLAHPAAPHLRQYAELALFGITQYGAGLLLLNEGAKRLAASRAALIGGLDVPLAPIWVWLAFAQIPNPATIAGGALVIAAVVLNTLLTRSSQALGSADPNEDQRAKHSEMA